jgi:hypothetical protein
MSDSEKSVRVLYLNPGAFIIALSLWGVPALADSAKATQMWGTGSSSSSVDDWKSSAEFHATGGIIAGQVNAARRGILLSGPNLTVVGSQSVISVTGNNNVIRDVRQSAENSGDISAEGSFNN